MYKSNYDKYPATPMEGIVWKGWENICNQLKSSLSAESCVLVIECYQGAALEKVLEMLKEKGYEVVPVSRMIYRKNFYMDGSGRQFLKK